jgi:hypothetical protein
MRTLGLDQKTKPKNPSVEEGAELQSKGIGNLIKKSQQKIFQIYVMI